MTSILNMVDFFKIFMVRSHILQRAPEMSHHPNLLSPKSFKLPKPVTTECYIPHKCKPQIIYPQKSYTPNFISPKIVYPKCYVH